MQNHRHGCSWRSKYQSEAITKNNEQPGLETTGAYVVECQSNSYTCGRWCFGNR